MKYVLQNNEDDVFTSNNEKGIKKFLRGTMPNNPTRIKDTNFLIKLVYYLFINNMPGRMVRFGEYTFYVAGDCDSNPIGLTYPTLFTSFD